MTITQDELDEFKTLYFNRYGERLNDEQANDIGMRLLNLLGVVAKRGSSSSPFPIDGQTTSDKVGVV